MATVWSPAVAKGSLPTPGGSGGRGVSPSKGKRLLLYQQRKVEEEGWMLSRLQLEERGSGECLGLLGGGAAEVISFFLLLPKMNPLSLFHTS